MGWRVIALITLIGCGRSGFEALEYEVSIHGTHGCALSKNGLWCWGGNMFGQLGEGSPPIQLFPHRVPNVPLFDRVDTGEWNTFGLSGGELWAWGGNASGQLGIGVVTPGAEPMPRMIASDVVQTASGQQHTCTVHGDGTLSCWGENSCNQLGDGTLVDQYAPQRVPGLSSITSVGVSDIHTCAIDSSGTLICWGACVADPPTPITLPRVVQVEGGCHYTICALEEIGRVWCIGENGFGQLGDGTTSYRGTFTKPVDFGADPPRIVEIAVGSYTTCARSGDHRVWCWGENNYGQLGTGDVAPMQPLPQQLPFFDGSIPIDDLEAACGFSCARSGLYLYCWGNNQFGQHGDGGLDVRFEPIRVQLDLR